MDTGTPLDAVADRLACPHCGSAPLRPDGRSLRCPEGHAFDLARQGYVSLFGGRGRRFAGDDAAMVEARERFLSGDHYRPLRSTITALAAAHAPDTPLVVDLAGGTGHYLESVVDSRADARGLTVDVSVAALRRAARLHPRIAAAAADVTEPLPLVDGAAGTVLSVFGPRNAAEITRVLAADGVLVVASAAPDHLAELRGLLGTIGVAPDKAERLSRTLEAFVRVDHQAVTWRLALAPDDVRAVATMGPSAHHLDAERLRRTVDGLGPVTGVTAAIDVAAYRPRRG